MISPPNRIRIGPDYEISRIIKGGWQLAGGHGRISEEDALTHMEAYLRAGITTFDCADIYTGVEELIGAFLRRRRREIKAGDLPQVQVHTKYVPDRDILPSHSIRDVQRVVDRSLSRLGVERLDLVQFHWWDFRIPGYVEACGYLDQLRHDGKIRHIGVTNFDGPHLRELIDAGVPIASNQVQYSVIDHRTENGMSDYCLNNGISLLCYGTVAGGFLSDRYLGTPEPQKPQENRSLTKYQLMIDETGEWPRFQSCLELLRHIADKNDTNIATIATAYTLQKPAVAAAIVGARNLAHLDEACRITEIQLNDADMSAIARFATDGGAQTGNVYDLERDPAGHHAAIMNYNLNRE